MKKISKSSGFISIWVGRFNKEWELDIAIAELYQSGRNEFGSWDECVEPGMVYYEQEEEAVSVVLSSLFATQKWFDEVEMISTKLGIPRVSSCLVLPNLKYEVTSDEERWSANLLFVGSYIHDFIEENGNVEI